MAGAIPRRLPRLAFSAEAPAAWWEGHQIAVPAGDAILLACGWDDDRDLIEARPALIALDATTGAERFRLDVPVRRPGLSEGQVGRPVALPGGRILVPVYQWDVALTVYLLDEDGRILREDELGDENRMVELDLYGGDLGMKLFLGDLVVAGDAYLASWVYRSRSHHLMCRELATGEPRWEADEWLLACAGGIAVGESDPPHRARIAGADVIARDLERGEERWRLRPERALEPDAKGAVPHDPRPVLRTRAGVLGDAILFIDRARRGDALLRRDHDTLEQAVAATGEPDWDELERTWDAAHAGDLAEDLVACDLQTGGERWRLRAGQVISAASGQAACVTTLPDPNGPDAELVHVDPSGTAERRRLPLEPGDARRQLRAPRAVAIDDELVLWASATELVCVERAHLDRESWRLPLPAPCEADPPRVRDRDLRAASIAVSDGRLYLRDGRRVWGFE